MTPDYDWALGRTFLAVVRTGSFSSAARRLGQTPPTTRRQVERLETDLGTTLFSRAPDGVRPTPTADLLTPYAERMEAAARAFARAAERGRFSGVVRIAADETIGGHLLPAILADLRTSHPDLRFEVRPRLDAPSPDGSADLVLSTERPTDEGALASRLGLVGMGLYAARRWTAANDPPRDGAELAANGILIGHPSDRALMTALGIGHGPLAADGFALSTTSQAVALGAVVDGLGVGLLPVARADAEPRLERVLPDAGATLEVWMAVHPDLRDAPQVRTLLDAIRSRLRKA